MAAQKHTATGTDLLEKEKQKKRQITYKTFEKWQRECNADY